MGADNKPKSTEELLNPYNASLSEIPATSKIIYSYDEAGNLIESETGAVQDFESDKIEESVYKTWLTLAKGSGIKGSDHSEKANALYFFENMQGDFSEADEQVKKEHNKEVTEAEINGV
ncbi:MAG: hypothetical protein K2N25_06390, partial [Muribaculaceae bacterium]|nr:hypothetical protein [Muribaculaceae bacterium]